MSDNTKNDTSDKGGRSIADPSGNAENNTSKSRVQDDHRKITPNTHPPASEPELPSYASIRPPLSLDTHDKSDGKKPRAKSARSPSPTRPRDSPWPDSALGSSAHVKTSALSDRHSQWGKKQRSEALADANVISTLPGPTTSKQKDATDIEQKQQEETSDDKREDEDVSLPSYPSKEQQQHSAQEPSTSNLPLLFSNFEYALRPWLNDNPEYRAYLDLPLSTLSSSTNSSPRPLSRAPTPSPVDGSDIPSNMSTVTDDGFSFVIPFPGFMPFAAQDSPTGTRICVLIVRILLLRCSFLARMARELELGSWQASAFLSGRRRANGMPAYFVYSNMNRIVDRAAQIANQMGNDGLQARCWYWKGRACGGQLFWDEAAAAFRRAILLDPDDGDDDDDDDRSSRRSRSAASSRGDKRDKVNGKGGEEKMSLLGGLTPRERSDVWLLKASVEKRSEEEKGKKGTMFSRKSFGAEKEREWLFTRESISENREIRDPYKEYMEGDLSLGDEEELGGSKDIWGRFTKDELAYIERDVKSAPEDLRKELNRSGHSYDGT